MMPEPTIGLFTMDKILFNPYLVTLVGIGWICIIINHFKIYWRIKDHFECKRIARNLSDDELKRDCEIMEKVYREMLIDYPNHKRENLELELIKEYFKRFNKIPTLEKVK